MFNTQQKSLSWADCNLRWTLSENNKHAKPCKYTPTRRRQMKTKIYTRKRRRVEKPQRQQLFIENFFCVPRQFSVKFPHHRGRRRCLSFMWQRTSRGKLIQPQKELFSIMSWCSTTASYCFSHSLFYFWTETNEHQRRLFQENGEYLENSAVEPLPLLLLFEPLLGVTGFPGVEPTKLPYWLNILLLSE